MLTLARENEEKFDHISNLPDELLCHVLSLLTTNEAGLTSVLSKRWRNLLTCVPHLDLDDSVFLHPEEGTRDEKEIIQSFMNSVDRTLALQGNSHITKFSLKGLSAVDSRPVNSWICNVLQRCVLDMDLFIKFGFTYRMPSEILMSRTLVELKIRGLFPILLRPGHICLPMLKTLALDFVTLYGGGLQILLSACPVLEELDMTNFIVSNGDETVSSPSLKTLTIRTVNALRALSFDAPNLVCLKYSGIVRNGYPLVNLENLVEAHIEFQSPIDLDNARKLVSGIHNVQKLYLYPGVLKVVVGLCSPAIPRFNNLTFLDISSLDAMWPTLPVFLQNCPHLETLVLKGLLHHVTDHEYGDSCICISRVKKGRLLVSCPVKRLEIRGFEGFKWELEMIKHFLDYFPCLKEMEIYITDGPTPHRSQAPLVQELNPEMLMRCNELWGHNRNVEFNLHGSLPWTAQ